MQGQYSHLVTNLPRIINSLIYVTFSFGMDGGIMADSTFRQSDVLGEM